MPFADERANDIGFKLFRLGGGTALPRRAVQHPVGFVRFHIRRVLELGFAQFFVAGRIQLRNEMAIRRIEACLKRRAGLHWQERLQHCLHRTTAAPFVNLHLERRIHQAGRFHQRLYVGAVEHDARHVRSSIGKRA